MQTHWHFIVKRTPLIVLVARLLHLRNWHPKMRWHPASPVSACAAFEINCKELEAVFIFLCQESKQMFKLVFSRDTIQDVRNANIKRNAPKKVRAYTLTHIPKLQVGTRHLFGVTVQAGTVETRNFVMTVCINFVKLSRRKN